MKLKLVIKNTHKYGQGVFAGQNFKKGTSIHVLNGSTLTLRQVVEKVLKNNEDIDDPLQVGRRTYIDLDKLSHAFNHSCDPSAGVRNRSELFALHDIKRGEEITYDYSMTIAPTEWKMRCKCGSKKCRHVIGDVRSVPKIQRDKYVKIGAVQRYMRPILEQLARGRYEVPSYESRALKRLGKMKHHAH